MRQLFNDTDADQLWLVVGAPPEGANTLEMSEELLRELYPDGPRALPPELAAERLARTGPGTRFRRCQPSRPRHRLREQRRTLAARRGRAGSGMAFLDGTVVNVALPDIGRDFGASTSALQWILNGYLLTLASLILLGGSLGDRYGRRRIFVLGVGLFTAASLLCAIAPSAELLIVARLLQGVGGALLTPGSLAMIEASFRPGDRARAIGAWSGLGGVAAALGPLLGGYLIGAISWRAIFLINLPLGIFVAWAAPGTCRRRSDPTATGRIDLRGAALAALGLAGTTYALIEAPGKGASAAILVAGIGGVLALVAFFVGERRSANPMLPLEIFRSRQFSAANGVTFVVYAALGGVFFLLVSFLQISIGYTPIEAGAASLPVTLLMLLFSARSGALAQRIGATHPADPRPAGDRRSGCC